MSLRNSLHEFVPPILSRRGRRGSPPSKLLFGGQDSLFRRLMSTCSVYGEYGIGLSTITAFRDYRCDIVAVDTSQEWINEVAAQGVDVESDRVHIDWIDVGPVTDWGRPASYDKAQAFPEYTERIWISEKCPDLVLIDGRFRVASFLESLLRGEADTRIIFDDYVGRPYYHIVENHVRPLEVSGRQALFVIPRVLDRSAVRRMYEQFVMVMD